MVTSNDTVRITEKFNVYMLTDEDVKVLNEIHGHIDYGKWGHLPERLLEILNQKNGEIEIGFDVALGVKSSAE